MKLTLSALKFTLPALLAGAFFFAQPNVSLAQQHGGPGSAGRGNGGGRQSSGGSRSFQGSGQQFSGQRGGQSFAAPRGGQSFSGQRSGQRGFSGGQNFSGQRNFSGGERGFEGRRDFDRGRGYRGGYSFGYSGAPYYYGGYGACNPNGYYDQFGNWRPDPRCSYNPYAYPY